MEPHQLDTEYSEHSETDTQTLKPIQENESIEFLSKLIEIHEQMIEQHKTAIKSIVNRIQTVEKGKHISDFLSCLNLSFKTEKISDAFNEWCYDNISLADITLKSGSYLAKRGIHVNIYTCEYLEQRLLYHCNENFSEYVNINGGRLHEINPKSLYPKEIQTKDQLCDYFNSLYEKNSQECVVNPDNMLDFMIVYWFAEMFNEGLYYDWELSVEEDFSKYDY